MPTKDTSTGRRGFLLAAGTLAATPLISSAQGQTAHATLAGRRKLGTLEVSNLGLGVQNMSRSYQTTIPSRPEMHQIIRTAYERGVTLFDAAEAYGPHEVERILGEGVAPFRKDVVIATKFGWNIDQQTGQRRPGLNSRPRTSSWSWKACSSACARTASTCCTSTGSTRKCRSRTWTAPCRS